MNDPTGARYDRMIELLDEAQRQAHENGECGKYCSICEEERKEAVESERE